MTGTAPIAPAGLFLPSSPPDHDHNWQWSVYPAWGQQRVIVCTRVWERDFDGQVRVTQRCGAALYAPDILRIIKGEATALELCSGGPIMLLDRSIGSTALVAETPLPSWRELDPATLEPKKED